MERPAGESDGGALRVDFDRRLTDGWRDVLAPVVARYRNKLRRRYFRGDADFANPELYEFLEAEGYKYTIRLPANAMLQESIGWLLKQPVGRPPHVVRRYHASFSYEAGSWTKPRRVVANVEWHPSALYPLVGSIVTNMTRAAERVVVFYNHRGMAEHHIKQGKNAVTWTRLSCHRFAANAVRLQLHALAYNLAILPAQPRIARGGETMVHDEATRQAGEDRLEDRPSWPIDHLPDGRGHRAAHSVPTNRGLHRRAASVAVGKMLRTHAHAEQMRPPAGDVRADSDLRAEIPGHAVLTRRLIPCSGLQGDLFIIGSRNLRLGYARTGRMRRSSGESRLKVSQAVSGEIVLEKLLDTLMRSAIEHAGAEWGLSIRPHGAEQRIAAGATIIGETVVVHLRDQPASAATLSESIIHYVVRTRESVILDDASTINPFAGDRHFSQHHAHSILCLPLTNEGKLTGQLYLENNLAVRVFTPERIAVLKLLASQAATSLENARLHAALINENRARRQAEENLRRSEAFLIQAQQISQTGSWYWNVNTGEVRWSAEHFRIFGYDPAATQPSYAVFVEPIHPEDRPSIEQTIATAVAERSHYQLEYRIVMADGSMKHLLSLGRPNISESGDLEYVGTVMDITAQTRGSRSPRERATLPRDEGGAGARQPRRDDGAADRLNRT
jgi:PAS domain S-box-containing protein